MKNYPLYENPYIKDIWSLLELGLRDGEDIAFSYIENKEIINKSYKDLYRDVTMFSNYLAYKYKDKHIAIIGNNSYNYIVVFLSIIISGNTAVLIDKDLNKDDISKNLKYTDTKDIFYAKDYCSFVSSLGNTYPLEDIEMLYIKDAFKVKTDIYRPACIFFTSGTTGFNKAVMLSEESIVNDIMDASSLFKPTGSVFSCLPFHHAFGLITGILKPIYYHKKVFLNSSLKNMPKELKIAKPYTMFVVPAFIESFYKMIWQNARKTKKDKLLKLSMNFSKTINYIGIDKRRSIFKSILDNFGGNLEYIICGGAPLEKRYVKWFRSIGINILNGYGITECSPVVSVNRNHYYKDGSVGVVAPNIEVKIVDKEILIKGNIVMLGYYKDNDSTKKVLKDGWFYTGDLGYIDDDNFLFINGRKKNLIILSNGENIVPEEIESKLLKDKGIEEVVITSLNNQLVAYIYPEETYLENYKYFNNVILKYNKEVPKNHQISKYFLRTTEFKKNNNHKILRDKIMEE